MLWNIFLQVVIIIITIMMLGYAVYRIFRIGSE